MPAIAVERCCCCSEVASVVSSQESVVAPCAMHQKQRTSEEVFLSVKKLYSRVGGLKH